MNTVFVTTLPSGRQAAFRELGCLEYISALRALDKDPAQIVRMCLVELDNKEVEKGKLAGNAINQVFNPSDFEYLMEAILIAHKGPDLEDPDDPLARQRAIRNSLKTVAG